MQGISLRSLTEALDFIFTTQSRGVPLRVCLKRAERRFNIDAEFLRTLVRSQRPSAA
jgi:hypothetical protein